MSTETIDIVNVEVIREDVQVYRKTATVRAGRAVRAGTIPTLEGNHSFAEGDYIAGPGAGGEFWPVKRDIFERTYAVVGETPPDLEGLWALSDAATPGPWTQADNGHAVIDVALSIVHCTEGSVDAISSVAHADAALIVAAVNYVRASVLRLIEGEKTP